MEFFRNLRQSLLRSFAKALLAVVSEKVIRDALVSTGQYRWEDDDQKVLESFLSGPTGAKLLFHLNSSLNGMLLSASNDQTRDGSFSKLNMAKGFSLAIGAIRLSTPTPYLVPDKESPEEEEKKKQADPFVQVKSSPTIF